MTDDRKQRARKISITGSVIGLMGVSFVTGINLETNGHPVVLAVISLLLLVDFLVTIWRSDREGWALWAGVACGRIWRRIFVRR